MRCEHCGKDFDEEDLGPSSTLPDAQICKSCRKEEEKFFETIRDTDPSRKETGQVELSSYSFGSALSFLKKK